MGRGVFWVLLDAGAEWLFGLGAALHHTNKRKQDHTLLSAHAPTRSLLQDPSCVNLADWYQAFAAVHGGQDQGGQEAGGSGGKPRKKAAVKTKGRGRSKAAAAGPAAGAAAASAGGGAALSAEQAREVAARFSQATAELQYVGLIKPARRRRGDYVQRTAHMPAVEV